MSLHSTRKIFALFAASALSLAACQTSVSVQPQPSPTATPIPSATPLPSPTPTPGWTSVTLRPTAATNEATLAEVRRLEADGQVSGVVVLESLPVQIQLSGSAEAIAHLQEVAAGVKDIAFTSLSQRSSNIHEAGTRVVTDAEAFRTLWQQHTSSFDTPPSVDFATQSVVAVFAGEKPTGGYTASVISVKQLDKTLTVHFKVTAPAAGSSVTQVITYPAHIVSIPLSKQKGDFDQVNFVEDN